MYSRVGVHSRSTAAPLKSAGFADPYQDFGDAKSYADWQFVIGAAAQPKALAPAAPGGEDRQPTILQPVPASSFAPRPAAP